MDQSFFLARQIEVSTIEEIQQRLTEVYLTMERPSLLRSAYIVQYFLVLVVIILAQMAVFGVIARKDRRQREVRGTTNVLADFRIR